MKRFLKISSEELIKLDFTQSWSISPIFTATLNEKSIEEVVWSEDGTYGTVSYDTIDQTEPHTYSYISPETGQVTTHTLEVGVYGRPLFYDANTMTEITQEDVNSLVNAFPGWVVGETFELDENGVLPVFKRKYNGKLYLVVQPHTSQANWTPDIVPALYREIFPEEVIAPWVQPTGAHDAYQIGDKVTHNGFTWESTVANNVWEPSVFGWIKI